MEFPCMRTDPPFHNMLRASGQGEVWQDNGEDTKFCQYGWRCSTSEDAYSNATLIGNWSEERFNVRGLVAQRRSLLSQYSNYFETTYRTTFNRDAIRRFPAYSLKKESHSFPGHQPELNPPHNKCVPNSTYRLDFRDHRQSQRGTETEAHSVRQVTAIEG